MQYLILGNGPAAVYAIRAVRRRDPQGDIRLITAEEATPYSPCLLTDLLAGRVSRRHLSFVEPDFFDRHKVEVIAGETAVTLNPDERQVLTDQGTQISYDRLLIAIGAQPTVPPVPGTDLSGVFHLKTLSDVERMLQSTSSVKTVVIVGAGFVGLETAQALREQGKTVIVVEMEDRVLPRMVDRDMAQPVEERLEANGVQVVLNARLEAIQGRTAVESVVVSGKTYPCELVVLATGIKPRIEMARNAGLKTARGILVDRGFRTSDTRVFAAGDVVETQDIFGNQAILANWPNATAGGTIAGTNMAGGAVQGPGIENLNVVHVFGLPVCSLGETTGQDSFSIHVNGSWKKYFLDDNRLVGLQWVGTVEKAGVVFSLIKTGRDVRPYLSTLLRDDISYGRLMKLPAGRPMIQAIGSA
jgi:NADPH-dependent 2,4-dienoyl-CoA reductase/sulfur reductase-like enzyme